MSATTLSLETMEVMNQALSMNDTMMNNSTTTDTYAETLFADVDEGKADDPTWWLLDAEISQFLLLKSTQVAYVAMLVYTFMHGKYVRMSLRFMRHSFTHHISHHTR